MGTNAHPAGDFPFPPRVRRTQGRAAIAPVGQCARVVQPQVLTHVAVVVVDELDAIGQSVAD